MFNVAMTSNWELRISLKEGFGPGQWPAYADAYRRAMFSASTPCVMVFDLVEWAWPDMGTILELATKKQALSSEVRWWSAMRLQGVVIITGSPTLTQLVQSLLHTCRLTSPLYCVTDREDAERHILRLGVLARWDLRGYTMQSKGEGTDGPPAPTWKGLGTGRALALVVVVLLRAGLRIPAKPRGASRP